MNVAPSNQSIFAINADAAMYVLLRDTSALHVDHCFFVLIKQVLGELLWFSKEIEHRAPAPRDAYDFSQGVQQYAAGAVLNVFVLVRYSCHL